MSRDGARPARAGRTNGKRERILDAATALFAGQELSRVTMDEVASRARVAKGTLYNHFQSKEDLYFSIITARMDGLLAALRELFVEEESASARLRKIAVHLLMFLVKYPDFFRILRKEGSCPAVGAPREVGDLRRDLRRLVRDVVARGVREGVYRPIDPDFATDVILGCIEGAALRWVEEGRKPARGGTEPEVLFDFIRAGLGAAEAGPLAGRRILVTREEGPDGALSQAIAALGGEPVLIPLVRTAPPEDPGPLRRAAAAASRYDWIVFTSARGVDAFASARGAGRPLAAATRLAAVGPATARRASERFGRVDLTAEESTGVGLAAALAARESLEGKRVLLPRAEEGGKDLPAALRAAGARVEDRIAYRTLPNARDPRAMIERLRSRAIDVVTFASASAAKTFAERIGAGHLQSGSTRIRVVSIGPSTSATLRSLGIEPDAEAREPSMESLAAACVIVPFPPKRPVPPIGATP